MGREEIWEGIKRVDKAPPRLLLSLNEASSTGNELLQMEIGPSQAIMKAICGCYYTDSKAKLLKRTPI